MMLGGFEDGKLDRQIWVRIQGGCNFISLSSTCRPSGALGPLLGHFPTPSGVGYVVPSLRDFPRDPREHSKRDFRRDSPGHSRGHSRRHSRRD